MNILSLDLGTKTGWAFGRDGNFVSAGTWTLATPKEITAFRKLRMDRRGDPRFNTLLAKLQTAHVGHKFDCIVFEDVQFSSSTQQTQLWSSLRGAVWAMQPHCMLDCLATGKLKQFATGSGAADKVGMAKALVRNYPNLFVDSLTGPMIRSDIGADEPKQAAVNRCKSEGTSRAGSSAHYLDDNAVDAAHLLFWAMNALKNTANT